MTTAPRLATLTVLLAVTGGLLPACTSGAPPTPAASTSRRLSTPGPTGFPSTGTGGSLAPPTVCPVVPEYARPPAGRPRYTMTVNVHPTTGTVDGTLSVTFTPDIPTDRMVFRLWPNGPVQAAEGAHLSTGPVGDGAGRTLRTDLANPTTLVVRLGRTFPAAEPRTATMDWHLTLPGAVVDRLGHEGQTVRLGSFFPLLAWQPGAGWATDPPTTSLAETSTSPTADFAVRISAPRGLRVLASGTRVGPGRWEASAVRDFALAVGPFDVVDELLFMPNPVTVTVAIQRGLPLPPAVALGRVEVALTQLEWRYGQYPWTSFTMVMTRDLGRVGIEYPTLVFEGGLALLRVTTHEVAHQWFYSLVGNDQARDPWLDEALASWSASRIDGYFEYFVHLRLRGVPLDHVGSPMSYWDRHSNVYELGVYVRGVQALAALGSPVKVDCALRLYVARDAYGIAHPADLIQALGSLIPDAPGTLARFGIHG